MIQSSSISRATRPDVQPAAYGDSGARLGQAAADQAPPELSVTRAHRVRNTIAGVVQPASSRYRPSLQPGPGPLYFDGPWFMRPNTIMRWMPGGIGAGWASQEGWILLVLIPALIDQLWRLKQADAAGLSRAHTARWTWLFLAIVLAWAAYRPGYWPRPSPICSVSVSRYGWAKDRPA